MRLQEPSGAVTSGGQQEEEEQSQRQGGGDSGREDEVRGGDRGGTWGAPSLRHRRQHPHLAAVLLLQLLDVVQHLQDAAHAPGLRLAAELAVGAVGVGELRQTAPDGVRQLGREYPTEVRQNDRKQSSPCPRQM